MSMGGDSWYVKLSDGDVHRVTLDQLDEAFQAGHIDEDTMILASGGTQWTKLGDLAGMGDDDEPVEAAPAPQAYAASYAAPAQAYAPRQAAPAPAASRSPYAGVPAYGAPASYAPSAQSAAYGARAGYSTPPAYSGAPAPYVPRTPVPNSLRPLSVDFGDLDDDGASLRSKGSGKRWLMAVVAMAVIGGAGTVTAQRPSWAQPYLSRIGLHHATTVAAAAPAPPPPVAEAAPTPAPDPAPQAAAPPPSLPVAPATDSPLNPHFTDSADHLTPDQKQRLAETDKAKAKGHGRGHSAVRSSSGSKSKSSVFTTGGSKFDPLNSSI